MTKAERDHFEFNKVQGDVVTSWRINCHFCGMSHSEDEDRPTETKEQFATERYREGWNMITSKLYGVVAMACPECRKKPDSER